MVPFRSWRKKQVLELLLKHPAGLTTKDLVKILGVKIKTISRLMTRWRGQGIMVSSPSFLPSRGRPVLLWKITKVGRDRLRYWAKKQKKSKTRMTEKGHFGH